MAKIPDALIDDILASANAYMGNELPQYSASRIDALVADILAEKNTAPVGVTETAEKVKPVAAEKTFVEKAEVKRENKFKISLPQIDKAVEERLQEKTGEVTVAVADGGQLSLQEDGDLISTETPVIEAKEEKTPEIKVEDTQISIEKTRMFNEVDIRGAYNPNISHNLGNKVARTTTGDGEALSSPVMANEKYRTHFMNKPVQNIEKTQEHKALIESLPQRTIETPAVVVKRKSSHDTDGVEPIPSIIPAEEMLEKEVGIEKKSAEDNQLMLEGFEVEEPMEQVAEAEAEADLRERRKGVVNDFVNKQIFTQAVPEDEALPEGEEPREKRRYERKKITVAREYYGEKDKKPVLKEFDTEKKTVTVRLVVLSLICGAMGILAAVAGAENGNFEIYGNNEYVYVAVQMLLLICACLLNLSSFKNAFIGLKAKTVDIDTVISLSAIVGFLQCAVGFAFSDNVESTARLLTGAAVVPMLMKAVTELVRCKNDTENFVTLAQSESLYSVENIDNEDTANEIARGLMLGDPDIKFSRKIGFPARFVELSRSAEVTGPLLKIAVPAVLLTSLLAALIYGIYAKNFFAGVSTLTAAVLMGLPTSVGLCTTVNLRSVNKKLNGEGALINGYSAVEDAVNSNGVVIDAFDAFQQGGCNIEGMKIYHKMRVDEAILYTASVVIASGGVLAQVWDGVIMGKRQLLLPVESLAYEEKLGCSCWIHNHRVLVGNRELLVHHNVEVPDNALEEKLKANGKNVIYLAIEGKVSAMFVVVYKANPETSRYMRELEKDGLTIFFRTSDANINEAFLEKEFGLPKDVVKIINPVAGEMFTKVKNRVPDRADTKIIHDGNIKTMLMALHGSFTLSNFINLSKTVGLVASFLGVMGVVLLAFLSGLVQVGVWQIIIYQVIWAAILTAVSSIKKL